MKYFLDSAKLDEIKLAYNTFGIDGVTTNPRHIMLSGKPFLTAITDIANWIKEEGLEGYEKFPVSVEINPHLDDTEEMIAAAKKVSAISENFVIKIPCTEAGVAAARRLEKEGIRTNVTLVFSPAQASGPQRTVLSSFPRSWAGKRPTVRTASSTSRTLWISIRTTASTARPRSSAQPSAPPSRSWTARWQVPTSLPPAWPSIRTPSSTLTPVRALRRSSMHGITP